MRKGQQSESRVQNAAPKMCDDWIWDRPGCMATARTCGLCIFGVAEAECACSRATVPD